MADGLLSLRNPALAEAIQTVRDNGERLIRERDAAISELAAVRAALNQIRAEVDAELARLLPITSRGEPFIVYLARLLAGVSGE